MSSPLRIRVMTEEDLSFADSVRTLAGWNQTPGDWRRFLEMEPGGCFVAEWDGSPAGTATTIAYGLELAWIGMVLVHPDYRRRGIGNALLHRCIESLRARGVRCIKLDATPLGRTVYENLGFKSEWSLARWERVGTHPELRTADPDIRAWRETDATLLDRADAAAFGTSRLRLLRTLAATGRDALVLQRGPGPIAAYGMLRSGSRALYVGPCSASSPADGIRVIAALVQRCGEERIFWDIPDANEAAVEWARQHGFTQQRPLLRMFLGENIAPGDPWKQFALAGPEVG